MVQISIKNDELIVTVKGIHKLWALKNKLTIPLANVVKVYQSEVEFNEFKGIRFGTYIPFLITAGTYFWKGKRNFWDVMKTKNTVIIELQNNYYNKLYLEVDNVEQVLELLKQNQNEK